MTAIYASYSQNSKKFAMGADNLEGNEGKSVSKIRFILDRYVIGVAGCDNPIFAIDTVVGQNSVEELTKELSDIVKLVANICEWTKEYTEAQIKQHGNDENAKSAFNNAQSMTTTLVVFDHKDFKLYECELGHIFPPDSFNPSSIRPVLLEQEKLLLFALAQTRNGNKKIATLPSDFYLDVKSTFEKMIQLDKETLDRERAIQGEAKVPHLGELGSYCYFEDDSIKYVKNL